MIEPTPDIELVRRLADEQAEENKRFAEFVRNADIDDERLDELVRKAFAEVEARIDCTACSFCCHVKSYPVDEKEMRIHATAVGLTLREFLDNYEVREDEGLYIIENYHCKFLSGGACDIYEQRPRVCREYPNFEANFRSRLGYHLDNLPRCPLVYFTFEALKPLLGFTTR